MGARTAAGVGNVPAVGIALLLAFYCISGEILVHAHAMDLKVTPGQIISRGLTNRCPNCGGRTLFKEGTWFELNRTCPRCGLVLEKDEGFFLGSMSLNYGVTIVAFLVPVLLLYLAGIFSGFAASIITGVGAIVVPILFYRSSRSWWLMNYYVFLPQHLPANRGEIPPGEDENI